MKVAKVVPIFKDGKRFDTNNYRPISVLPIFSKIFEKIMNNKLMSFLNKYNVLSNEQYGFRNAKDIEVTMVDIVTNIQQRVDENHKCAIVSLDLRKAFKYYF